MSFGAFVQKWWSISVTQATLKPLAARFARYRSISVWVSWLIPENASSPTSRTGVFAWSTRYRPVLLTFSGNVYATQRPSPSASPR